MCSGARQYLLCDGYNARMRNTQFVARCFCYLACFSCAKLTCENDLNQPLKLW